MYNEQFVLNATLFFAPGHKLKWSGMLGLLHLASRIYFPDMCLRRVSWYRLRMLPEACARKEEKIFARARAPKLQKIFSSPRTELSYHHGAAM